MAAMKILSLVGTVAAASAASSSTAGSSSSSRLPMTARSLQDADGSSYAFLDDLTGYQLKYSNCLRVKIPQDNDDDAVDGNVNFYNGRYHAQYEVFATFHVCGDGNYGDGNQCYDCDYSVEYATDMGQFLETSLDHWENYCGACQNACGGRKLEEEEQEEEMDCNTCSNECMNYYQGGDAEDGANDESAYIECQEGIVDDDGIQVYYGPQCSDDGEIVIGTFYDDECTIKTKHDYPEFDYYKFGTVSAGCVDCSSNAGGETCEGLYGDSFHCFNGKDQQGNEDDMKVCSAVKKATTTMDYSSVKKRSSGADTFIKVFLTLSGIGLFMGLFFLSYTYYIRHKGDKSQPMLSSDDVDAPVSEAPPGAHLT